MTLLVVVQSDGAEDLQLTEAQVQIAVESRLRSARLYGQPPENKKIVMPHPYLFVYIHAVGRACHVKIAFREPVKDHVTNYTGWAATWERTSTGMHGNDGGFILSSVSGLIDTSLVEYLRVNESACGGPGG